MVIKIKVLLNVYNLIIINNNYSHIVCLAKAIFSTFNEVIIIR